ncbi:MAG: hypothetical protein ACOCRX_11205 [Candidatus Woesearchaeota archaeon]
MKRNILILIIISLLLVSISSLAVSPEQPYNLILEAFSNGDLDRAYHWIKVTIDDFPESEEAQMSRWLRIPLLMTDIQSDIIVKNTYMEAMKTGLLDRAEFYFDLINPVFMVSSLNDLLSDENGFLTSYNNDKTYDFKLPKANYTDEYKVFESELNTISLGLTTKNSDDPEALREGIKPKFFPLYLDLFAQGLESNNNPEIRARLFYSLANSIYFGLIQIDYDDLTADIMGKYKTDFYETGMNCINIALELTDDNPYSNLRVDIETLEKDYKDIYEK